MTSDGGKTWKLSTGLGGYRSGVGFRSKEILFVVGSNGSDVSSNSGKTWSHLDNENYNSVQSFGSETLWAVGPNGMVSKFYFRKDVYVPRIKAR